MYKLTNSQKNKLDNAIKDYATHIYTLISEIKLQEPWSLSDFYGSRVSREASNTRKITLLISHGPVISIGKVRSENTEAAIAAMKNYLNKAKIAYFHKNMILYTYGELTGQPIAVIEQPRSVRTLHEMM